MITLFLAPIILGGSLLNLNSPLKLTAAPKTLSRPMNSTYRWSFLITYLQESQNLPTAIQAIDEAAAAGYNGIVLQDASFQEQYPLSLQYKTALATVMAEAKKLGMDVIPAILPTGGAMDILERNPSLVESIPCNAVQYVVTNGTLQISEPTVAVANANFESFTGNIPNGFTASINSDASSHQDFSNPYFGSSSLRVDGQTPPIGGVTGGAWFSQTVKVLPWHQYRINLYAMTNGSSGSSLYLNAVSPSGQPLAFMPNWLGTSTWTDTTVTFNSQGNSTLNLQVGMQPSAGSSIWADGLSIENVGLMNVTRRADLPLSIVGVNGVTYAEGTDVAPILDNHVPPGKRAGYFDTDHTPPVPTIPAGSKLQEGQQVLLSFSNALVCKGGVSICYSEPAAMLLIKQEINEIVSLMHPKYLLLDTDETRVTGWDAPCQKTGLNGSQLFGNLIQEEANMVKSASPTTQLVFYSDMFDPYQNARNPYYMMKGGSKFTTTYLPAGSILLNWNFNSPAESLAFFSNLGFEQILLGYYDNINGVPPIATWVGIADAYPGVVGFTYLSYLQDFSQLTTYMQQATGG